MREIESSRSPESREAVGVYRTAAAEFTLGVSLSLSLIVESRNRVREHGIFETRVNHETEYVAPVRRERGRFAPASHLGLHDVVGDVRRGNAAFRSDEARG